MECLCEHGPPDMMAADALRFFGASRWTGEPKLGAAFSYMIPVDTSQTAFFFFGVGRLRLFSRAYGQHASGGARRKDRDLAGTGG